MTLEIIGAASSPQEIAMPYIYHTNKKLNINVLNIEVCSLNIKVISS